MTSCERKSVENVISLNVSQSNFYVAVWHSSINSELAVNELNVRYSFILINVNAINFRINV